MKILYIGHEKELNGASKSVLDIIKGMENDHEIYVLTGYGDGPFYDALKQRKAKVLVYPYFKWCVGKFSKLGWIKKRLKWYCHQQFVNRKTAAAVAKIVRDEHIDLIHTNSGVINVGGLIRRACPDVKHIWHIREFADLDFRMYPLPPESAYYAFMNRWTDQFIFNSKAVAQHYTKLDPKKKNVVYNGVDPKNLIPESEREPHEGINLLIAGRVERAKGQYQAVEACEKLLQRGIGNFKLFIAGTVYCELDISEAVRDHVILLGQVSDMTAIRRKTDIELVCSRAEAFGRVTIEANLAGVPVVGSNIGGTRELIRDGVTGFLYEPENTDDLADKIEKLIRDETLRHTCGTAAREFAAAGFLADTSVKNLRRVYQKTFGEL